MRRNAMILLTDLLTAALDNNGYSWTKPPSASPASRPVRQLRTDLDGRNLATDQNVGGSSPAERALICDRITWSPSLLCGANALGHARHHVKRERRRLMDEEEEHLPVDHRQLGVGHRDNRRTSWGGIDDCHLTECFL